MLPEYIIITENKRGSRDLVSIIGVSNSQDQALLALAEFAKYKHQSQKFGLYTHIAAEDSVANGTFTIEDVFVVAYIKVMKTSDGHSNNKLFIHGIYNREVDAKLALAGAKLISFSFGHSISREVLTAITPDQDTCAHDWLFRSHENSDGSVSHFTPTCRKCGLIWESQ